MEQRITRDLEALGRESSSGEMVDRLGAAAKLGKIAVSEDSGHRDRLAAVELLARLLERERYGLVRREAARPFELPQVADLCTLSRRISQWWSDAETGWSEKSLVLSDDSEDWNRIHGYHLRKLGFQRLASRTDPLETIELVREAVPDVLITDVEKPVMDGIEMLRRIRQLSERAAAMPVLLVTADLRYSWMADDGLYDEYLLKPVTDVDLLREKVKSLLAGRFST